MTTVFISHSTRDSDFARRRLKPYLESHGIRAWFSEQDIPSAVDWEHEIRRALIDSQWYVVVLSPDAVKSDWVQAEVHWALENRKGCVIPIMIQECDPTDLHLKLLTIQYIDFRTDPNEAARRLLEKIQTDPPHESAGTAPKLFDEKQTTIIGLGETHLQFSVLTGQQKGEKLAVRVRRNCIIGRSSEANLRLLDDSVSRRHARLSVDLRKGVKRCVITDLKSANGTFVNECEIDATGAIVVGDVVDLGETRLRFESIV